MRGVASAGDIERAAAPARTAGLRDGAAEWRRRGALVRARRAKTCASSMNVLASAPSRHCSV